MNMKMKSVLTFLIVLIASILPDLFIHSPYLKLGKIIVLAIVIVLFVIIKSLRSLWKLPVILLTINAAFWISDIIRNTFWWRNLFGSFGFFSGVAGSVFVKVIGIIPVAAVLLLLMKNPKASYLSPGDLNVRADKIVWLGIRGDWIRWRKLAVVSGMLIMIGTILLSMITSTGFGKPSGFDRFITYLPIILLLAVVNSFCEGLVFRSAIMAPIHDIFPKLFVTLMPALFFGIAHYQGIPGGFLGAALSGLLGYYMSLSMYETRGFLSGWIIHVMQDVAIFSTLVLMG
jgi:Type II CAAX prenyl endopeptidase Rce1-like